jgi:ATP-dependent DNA helicase RecG
VTGKQLPLRFGGGRYDRRPPVTRLSFDAAALALPLAGLGRVTPSVARRLSVFGLETVGDLIEHFPRRYEDFRDRKSIRDLKVGEEATIRGDVVRVRAERTARRRVDIVRVLLRDDTGAVEAVWFNQRYLTKVLCEGMRLSLRGTYRPQSGRQQFAVKGHEILEEDGEGVHTEGVVPVYPASEQVSAKLLRALVHQLVPVMRRLPDPLPAGLVAHECLPGRADAVTAVHLPRTLAEARLARERLVLEELLLMQLGLLLHKEEQQQRVHAPAFAEPGDLARAFLDGLPFELTPHQLSALDELEGDLRRGVPMRRLLQGDVGSGKTVVALYCLVRAAEAGLQGVLLAPTETLAAQHAETAARLVEPLVSAELVTSSLTTKERREALTRIESGETCLAIGTHALLQEDVRFAALGLLVVDEQHRFGVEQRDALVRRAERDCVAPHVLHMTATPIPRTLALTVFGDLDVTTIAGVPSGRQPVVTRLVDEDNREVGYEFVRKQIAGGRQVYVVCPAIDESESISAATAVAEAARLQAGPFRHARVAVAHGQLKAADRDEVMRAFKGGDVDVLVATSLIEVGIDVPNATVMIVEGAERFGLAQLHQLRGRVGRGREKSYCLLFASAETGASQARLGALLETNDGFELADRDLEIRGEGQVMGSRQAGVPELKLARLARDRAALVRARELAAGILEADPGLSSPVNRPLKDAMNAAFGGELGWLLKA